MLCFELLINVYPHIYFRVYILVLHVLWNINSFISETYLDYLGAQEDNLNNSVRVFTYDELVSATYNFTTVIGTGGFGNVYEGRIGNEVTFFFVFH